MQIFGYWFILDASIFTIYIHVGARSSQLVIPIAYPAFDEREVRVHCIVPKEELEISKDPSAVAAM